MKYKYQWYEPFRQKYFQAGGMVTEGNNENIMHIQHEESDIRGRHFINDEEGNMLAEITYAMQHPDTMVVDHTEVSDVLKGKNIGFQLVGAVIEHARAKGRHVVAVCSFASAVIEKNPGFKDVITQQ